MSKPNQDKQFNDTLKRMMDSKPKPHEEMKKKGCGQKPLPVKPKR